MYFFQFLLHYKDPDSRLEELYDIVLQQGKEKDVAICHCRYLVCRVGQWIQISGHEYTIRYSWACAEEY